ncbi:sensor histidine kinase [Paraflavitalea speifideaquila]|uniref:sensor histidine kinase n=1 Tax=Paraflavitalea speifideaquila TaxID=3076558 RepID=UPI0028EDAA67|nr:histidine kinase [Paraflavitalea speifideiaquila]
MAGTTITYLLLHAAEVVSVLLVSLLLFNTGIPSINFLSDIIDLFVKFLLVFLSWWLTSRLGRLAIRRACAARKPAATISFNETGPKRFNDQPDVQVLKAQIQPHFLFNTLNRINASIPPQQEETRELIAKLADTFRYALQATKEDEVLLCEELHFIKTYLELEKERFGERLQVVIDASEEVMQAKIAPMLLQPLIENAVVHGVGPAINGGIIKIQCHLLDNKLQVCISNTGARYTGPVEWLMEGKGIGLRNTMLRLEKIYNEPMHIEKNDAGCLRFTFSVPLPL